MTVTTTTRQAQRAFTLVEMVIVIAITGVLVAAVAMFLRWPMQAYLDAARRADMTDVADTALWRIADDVRTALPNSARVTSGATSYLELLQMTSGWRYRAAISSVPAAPGDILDFDAAAPADDKFDAFSLVASLQGSQRPVAGNYVVVYNLGAATTSADSDAYQTMDPVARALNATANANVIASVANDPVNTQETLFTLGSVKRFPLRSPGSLMHVVSGPVSYICAPGAVDAQGNGTGTLTRQSGYAVTAAQGTPPAGGTASLVAKNVTGCTITYSSTGAEVRNALVSMQLSLTIANETVTLYHEAHVSNVP